MLRNYFTIAFRNMMRQKGYTGLNLAGLSLGIACCLFIFLFIRNEMDYDRFHRNGDRIFRVLRAGERNGEKVAGAYTSGPTPRPSKMTFRPKSCTPCGLCPAGPWSPTATRASRRMAST
jgi:putative ABC transport system permease protein